MAHRRHPTPSAPLGKPACCGRQSLSYLHHDVFLRSPSSRCSIRAYLKYIHVHTYILNAPLTLDIPAFSPPASRWLKGVGGIYFQCRVPFRIDPRPGRLGADDEPAYYGRRTSSSSVPRRSPCSVLRACYVNPAQVRNLLFWWNFNARVDSSAGPRDHVEHTPPLRVWVSARCSGFYLQQMHDDVAASGFVAFCARSGV